MKKLFSAILIIVNVNCFAQATKWFASFSVTPTLGGPSASLKKQMVDQHFNDVQDNKILFIEWTTKYPVVIKDAALLLRGGARLSDKRSIYFVVGQSSAGSVEGFKKQGSFDWWIVGGSTGKSIGVNFHTYQLTAGYLYSFANTKSKIGFGPSFFLFNYSIKDNSNTKESHNALSPGATFTTRLPLGRERKLFGLELVFEGNVAAPVKMKGDMKETGFQPRRVNMVSANLGLAFCFRN